MLIWAGLMPSERFATYDYWKGLGSLHKELVRTAVDSGRGNGDLILLMNIKCPLPKNLIDRFTICIASRKGIFS